MNVFEITFEYILLSIVTVVGRLFEGGEVDDGKKD